MKNLKLVINITFIVIVFSIISIILDILQCSYFTQIVFSLAFISVLLLIFNLYMLFLIKARDKENHIEKENSINKINDNADNETVEEDEGNYCLELVNKIDKSLSYSETIKQKFEKLANTIQLVAAIGYELEGDYLESVSLYALLKNEKRQTLDLDSSLTGQVAISGKYIAIDVKDKIDFEIISGLGESKPNYLYILPVFNKDKIIGVVEIATFIKLTERRINFLIEAFKK